MPQDKRKSKHYSLLIALFFVFVLWSLALALPDAQVTDTSSPREIELVQAQWKLIGGMFGLIQILIGYIYISGITSLKSSIRNLFKHIETLQEIKLSKEDHDRLCKGGAKK